MKYDFSNLSVDQNPMLGMMYEVNQASFGTLIYALLLLIFIVSLYSLIRTTNDIGKSYVFSVHIMFILSLLLYYMGKSGGLSLIPDLVMLGIAMLEIISVSVLYFMRNRGA